MSDAARVAAPWRSPAPARVRGVGGSRVGPGYVAGMAVVFSLLLPREFAGPDSPSPGLLYWEAFGGFRRIDVLLIVALVVVVGFQAVLGRRRQEPFPRAVAFWALAFAIAIFVSALYGSLAGGTELFFDWRNLALGGAFCVLISRAVSGDPRRIQYCAVALVAVLLGRIAVLLYHFAGGSGVVILGTRTPVFDGPTLSSAAFVGIAGTALAVTWGRARVNAKVVCVAVGAIGLLFVLWGFRRTYWAESFVGLGVLFLALRKGKAVAAVVVMSIGFLVFSSLGTEFSLRLQSINPMVRDYQNPYALTNEDHVNDLHDAWDVIQKDPVLGYGLGRPYQTNLVQNWKVVSWGVHNALLHVWLRYGLLGLISYVGFHGAVIRWLFRLGRRLPRASFEAAWVLATLAYVTATFVVSLVNSPWPYGAMQNSLLLGALFALALAIDRADRRAHRAAQTFHVRQASPLGA